MRDRFSDILHKDIIHGVSCAAHCINLVVTHAVSKSPTVDALIEKSRNLSKKLRTPTFRALMKDFGSPMAVLDVATRWNSIYTMVWHILRYSSYISYPFQPNNYICILCLVGALASIEAILIGAQCSVKGLGINGN